MSDNDPLRKLENKIGALAVQINRCQAYVFMIFNKALAKDIARAEAIFFTLRSDATQRDITEATVRAALFLTPECMATADAIIRELKRFNGLSGRRNDFIHSIWVTDENNKPTDFLGRNKRFAGEDPENLADELILELSNLQARLSQLDNRLGVSMAEQEAWIASHEEAQGLPPELLAQLFLRTAKVGGGGLLSSRGGDQLPPPPSEE